jgi:hypothetical protein
MNASDAPVVSVTDAKMAVAMVMIFLLSIPVEPSLTPENLKLIFNVTS